MAENLDNNEENIETEDTAAGEQQQQQQQEAKPIPEIDSKYRLILLAAQRSKQLQKGAAPRVSADPRKIKPTRIALEEFKQKKVNFEIIDEEK
ncbi:MAG: DNA-directed RNA polymerase subunit omega [Acidobacteriota bacterium]|nr:DNA-directed RNA polymerase subunit omega [Acidobacteriota bacterium]